MNNKLFSLTLALLFGTFALNAMDIEIGEVSTSKKTVTYDQLVKAAKYKNVSTTIQLLQKVKLQKNGQNKIEAFKGYLTENVKSLKEWRCLNAFWTILAYSFCTFIGSANIYIYKKGNPSHHLLIKGSFFIS